MVSVVAVELRDPDADGLLRAAITFAGHPVGLARSEALDLLVHSHAHATRLGDGYPQPTIDDRCATLGADLLAVAPVAGLVPCRQQFGSGAAAARKRRLVQVATGGGASVLIAVVDEEAEEAELSSVMGSAPALLAPSVLNDRSANST